MGLLLVYIAIVVVSYFCYGYWTAVSRRNAPMGSSPHIRAQYNELKGWASTVATGCASASCVYVALEPELVLPTPGQLPNMELQGGREVEG